MSLVELLETVGARQACELRQRLAFDSFRIRIKSRASRTLLTVFSFISFFISISLPELLTWSLNRVTTGKMHAWRGFYDILSSVINLPKSLLILIRPIVSMVGPMCPPQVKGKMQGTSASAPAGIIAHPCGSPVPGHGGSTCTARTTLAACAWTHASLSWTALPG